MNTADETAELRADEILKQLPRLSQADRRVLAHLLNRKLISRDRNKEFQKRLTVGQRLADQVAAFGGSWTFIVLFSAAMSGWVLFNVVERARFDPYPFILLNLMLSGLAALQAPVIMMSQNRHAAKDRLDAQHDYEINLKAEMEIMGLHAKLDELRERQWTELIALHQRQVTALERIEAKL
jgi:uncharacterized membrane protein